MKQIDRRNLIVGAGAGLMLTACSKEGPSNEVRALAAGRCTARTFERKSPDGIGEGYDCDFQGAVGNQTPENVSVGEYQPRHICLIYMKFDGGRFIAKHAHFAKDPNDAGTSTFVEQQFETVSHAGGAWDESAKSPGENFHRWGFGSQSKLYFFLDNGSDVVFDSHNLMQCMPKSARVDSCGANEPKDINNSFLNPKLERVGNKNVLTVQNWYRDEKGQPITAQNYRYYSMNIYVLMRFALGSGQTPSLGSCPSPAPTPTPGPGAATYWDIPLAIDPDTGNMGGDP